MSNLMLSDEEKEEVWKQVMSGEFTFQESVIPDYEDAISIAAIRKFYDKSLPEIISQALAQFGHSQCPYCQAFIGLGNHVTDFDIKEWIEFKIKEKVK